jgi:RHS repeat-associated protein
VSFTSDETGAVTSHYHYRAYALAAVHGSAADPLRFAGGAEIGDLMLLGARVYDPAVGRFLSPDPVFQLLNQYAYTLGNPVWYWDPDGAAQTDAQSKQAQAVRQLFVATLAWVGAVAIYVIALPAGPGPTAAAGIGLAVASLRLGEAMKATMEAFAPPAVDALPDVGSSCKSHCGPPQHQQNGDPDPQQNKVLVIGVEPASGSLVPEPPEPGLAPPSPPVCAPPSVELARSHHPAAFASLLALQLALAAILLRRRLRSGRPR